MNPALFADPASLRLAHYRAQLVEEARVGLGSAADTLRPLEHYQHDPVAFLVRELGFSEGSLRWSAWPEYVRHEWDGTPDPLVAIAEGLAAGEDVGVESAAGTGKSFQAAGLMLWFLASWRNARVYTYAPKEDQLRLFMWAEAAKMFPAFRKLFPTAVMTDLRIRMDGTTDRWAAHGYAVRIRAGEKSATGAQGAHGAHMLVITEETPGIDTAVMTAIRNTLGGEHNLHLALGNPDSQHDELHRVCTTPGVRPVRISALDHPNVVTGRDVVEGATGARRVRQAKAEAERWGEWRMYDSRIRGISPEESAEALIRGQWCREAMDRYTFPQYRLGGLALGVDVSASEGGDKGAIARGLGACLLEVESMPCPDPVAFGLRIGVEMKASDIDPTRVGVDSVGVGTGTIGRLSEMGYRVRGLNGGYAPETMRDYAAKERTGRAILDATEFRNLRAQMWWRLRLDLQQGLIALPHDEELVADLTAVRYDYKNGVVVVEPKEDLRARLGRSPDKGDACVYWNWVRFRGAPKEEEVGNPIEGYDHGFEALVSQLSSVKRRRAF